MAWLLASLPQLPCVSVVRNARGGDLRGTSFLVLVPTASYFWALFVPPKKPSSSDVCNASTPSHRYRSPVRAF